MMKLSMVLTALLLAGGAKQAVSAPTVGELSPTPAKQASTLAGIGRNPAEFPAYIERLKSKALAQGIPQSTVDSAFANVHFVDRVIVADRNQLEKKITLDDYLKRVLPAWKIQRGKEMRQRYHPQLARATARYGVPEPYIVALWGMESGFGKYQGKEDVISALSTLAFEGRREEFFTNQLMAALQIIEQGHVDAGNLKGSWAGAMGQCQFMPTSLLTYAADGDGDGKIDIWNNIDDIFASTANYLATEGWQPGIGWGREVKLPAEFDAASLGLKEAQGQPVAEWTNQGILLPDGSPGNDSNLLIVFYVQIMPDDFVMQLHRF